jgi:hypothetical protein
MEEADALCSNIGIMIRGQLRVSLARLSESAHVSECAPCADARVDCWKALGSSQELKSNYGEGYQITIRLGGTGADVDEPFAKVSELINSLSSSVKAEDSATMVKRYEVPAGEVSLLSHCPGLSSLACFTFACLLVGCARVAQHASRFYPQLSQGSCCHPKPAPVLHTPRRCLWPRSLSS